MKQSTIKQINEHLEKARKKHPEFAPKGRFQVISIATEELGKIAQAINDNSEAGLINWPERVALLDKIDLEVLDLIVVLIRFFEAD